EYKAKHENCSLSLIISSNSHAVVSAPELSGKSYLLEHSQTIIAENYGIPILLSPVRLQQLSSGSIYYFIAGILGFCTAKQVEDWNQGTRLFILIDDVD